MAEKKRAGGVCSQPPASVLQPELTLLVLWQAGKQRPFRISLRNHGYDLLLVDLILGRFGILEFVAKRVVSIEPVHQRVRLIRPTFRELQNGLAVSGLRP